jgi:hypothetical protein
MKKVFIALFLMAGVLNAQVPVNNTGNRLQTYPKITKANPEIQNMLNKVSIGNLKNSIQWLQNLECRDAQGEAVIEAQNWLVGQFQSFGLKAHVHYFSCKNSYLGRCTQALCNGDTLRAGNVYAVQSGTEFPDEYIFICSHYDQHDGPGADDNASGTAGIVEIARILSGYSFKRSIVYIAFNAEEYGMVGSSVFTKQCAEQDMNILGCFNLDMIGFFPEDAGALTMYAGSSDISDRLWKYYQTVANVYVEKIPTLRFTKGDAYGGDHQSFNIYEYPSIFIGDIEYFDVHPCIHRLCDTIGAGVNNLELSGAFVSATLAATAELANSWLPPQRLSAIPSHSKITVGWEAAPETVLYQLYKNDALFIETSETTYIDNDVADGAEYVYYVVGVHSESGEKSMPSNRDSVATSIPLPLPYFNDFETSASEFRFNDSIWELTELKAQAGKKSFTNVNTQEGMVFNNKLSVAELPYFSVPNSVDNLTLSFHYQGILQELILETIGCVEITTDRKSWKKLVEFPRNHPNWEYIQVSLNDYIGANFVQLRFRVESSGESVNQKKRQMFIDNLSINFDAPYGIKERDADKIQIHPNPSTGMFNIITGLNYSYDIVVYNLQGGKVSERYGFSDGILNVSQLPKGFYFLKIVSQDFQVTKKIVIQ